MINQKSLAALSVFAASIISVRAQTAAVPLTRPAPTVSVTLAPSVVSQYMFRGQRLGGISFQPFVEVDYDNLAAGVWSNFPIESKVPGVSDPEFDFYGSLTTTLNDQASLVFGFTYYYYPRAFTNAGSYRSTFEPSVAFNYTIAGIKFTPKVYYDVVLQGPTLELTAAYALPLKDLGTELDFGATGGTYLLRDAAKDSSPRTKAWGNYWLVGVSAPYQLTKDSKFIVGFAYTKGSDAFVKQATFPRASNPAAVGRGVVTLSYFYKF